MSARLRNLNPYELHKHLVNVYCLNKRGSTGALQRDTSNDRTDLDVIRENHRFLWEEDDLADTWEKQLAKKYYDKLFKEYCICDLSRYKENKVSPDVLDKARQRLYHLILDMKNRVIIYIRSLRSQDFKALSMSIKVALRWRVEQEVVLGKGQFQCGNKKCNSHQDLKSWEVNFAYKEDNERKNALVKLRLCPECSDKLNYKSKKREVKRLKRSQKKRSKRTSEDGESDKEKSPRTPEPEEPSTSVVNEEETTKEKQENSESLWKKGAPEMEEKSREEEFEEYLEDLLL